MYMLLHNGFRNEGFFKKGLNPKLLRGEEHVHASSQSHTHNTQAHTHTDTHTHV